MLSFLSDTCIRFFILVRMNKKKTERMHEFNTAAGDNGLKGYNY